MSYEVWHWRIFNVFFRLFTLMAIFVGLGFLAWGIAAVAGWAERYELGPTDGIVYLAVGSGSTGLGWLLLRRRAVRPDLGDPPLFPDWSGAYPRDHPLRDRPRNWWTGDPR